MWPHFRIFPKCPVFQGGVPLYFTYIVITHLLVIVHKGDLLSISLLELGEGALLPVHVVNAVRLVVVPAWSTFRFNVTQAPSHAGSVILDHMTCGECDSRSHDMWRVHS